MGRNRSRSPERLRRSRSRSRSRSRDRREHRRRSYSRSPRRDRDRSRSPRESRGGGNYASNVPRGRYFDGRDNPKPGPCLGVFGMSLHTSERELKHIFGKYGEIESVQIVYDRFSGRSRGFGFVYFTSTKDATKAKENLSEATIDGMHVRVDYSVTRGGGPYRHVSNDMSPPRERNGGRRRSRS